MSPNLRRYLPYIAVAFVLLLVLPAIFNRKATTAVTPATQARETLAAITTLDRSELAYHRSHGHYSGQLADLLQTHDGIPQDLTAGFTIQLDVGSDGQTYDLLVESPVLSVFRARRQGTLLAESCTVIKASTGVSCPTAKTATS